MTAPRPRPQLDAHNRAFWTGGAEGKLRIMKCADCAQFTHPPRLICRHCQSENMAPEAVSGVGAVDTFTINYQAWLPDLQTPYVIARVRLNDAPGVILTTNIIDCAPEDVAFDDAVQVTFLEQHGIYFPLFKKVN